MSGEKSIVVIDPGSGTFKCGEAGAFVPRVVFDSVVGKPKFPGLHEGMGPGDYYVGDEALTKRLVLDLDYCIDNGRFTKLENFDVCFL
jgi:actin beta/gamma 1